MYQILLIMLAGSLNNVAIATHSFYFIDKKILNMLYWNQSHIKFALQLYRYVPNIYEVISIISHLFEIMYYTIVYALFVYM